MIVLVDVDHPLAPIHTEWLRLINETYGDNLTIDDITYWDAILNKSKGGKKVFDLLPFVYANTKPTKFSLQGVQALRDMGNKVILVTSGIFVEKVDWLFEYGFSISKSRTTPSDIIIATDKSLVVGDVLIDDYYPNLDNREYPILFNAKWNEHIIGYPRAFDWNDVIHMVKNISREKEKQEGRRKADAVRI